MSNLLITPESMYIGEDIISGTSGSIPYIDSNKQLAQSNSTLFYDAPNKRVGVGTASPGATIEAMIPSSTEVGMIVQGAASQSGDLVELQDSSGNNLYVINSNGDITYCASNRTITSGISFFNSSSTLTLNNAASAPTFFRASNTINYTTTPTFGIGFAMFSFTGTVQAITNNLQTSPYIFFNSGTYNANGVVWTGGDIGGSFVDGPVFSVSNSGSFTTWTHTGFRSYLALSSGTMATRQAIKIQDTSGSGTLTTQVGLDIDTLTKGGTNIAIRTGASGSIQFGNLITKYNNISTVSNGVPSELATIDLATQSAAISATTLYTPAATGLFRVSAYLQVTRAATTSSTLGGATGLVIAYTDGDGSVAQSNTMAMASSTGTIVTVASTNTTTTNLTGSMIIYAKTGVAITYAIGYSSLGGTSMQYAAHLKVEAL